MTAKYREIFDKIRSQIVSGRFFGGRRFPSEGELARNEGVSRSTAHRVIMELRRIGLVTGGPGEIPRLTKGAASRKIGVIVPRHRYSEIFTRIIEELSRRAQLEGYTLLFGDISSADPVQRAEDVKRLAEEYVFERVAGVMFQPIEYVSGAEKLNGEVLEIFNRAEIAVVLCDYDIVPPPGRSSFDVVGMNNFLSGAAMTSHLLSAGASRIAFMMRPHSPLSIKIRMRGAQSEAVAAGRDFAVYEAEPDDQQSLRRYLRRFRPDAFLCGNDAIAACLKQSLEKLGKSVPDDVMLAGFDDVTLARFMSPPLTTMHQPCVQIADAVFDRLMARIANPDLPPQEIYLPGTVVVRSSTRRNSSSSQQRRKPVSNRGISR